MSAFDQAETVLKTKPNERSSDATPLESHKAPLHIRSVTLRARNMPSLARFYERFFGLETLATDFDAVTLGTGGVGYLTIIAAPDAKPETQSGAGLFHTAFLLPSRAALGAWFNAAREKGAPIEAASDHDVSEAFYLTDPEGNGIEVYADRPRDQWRAEGTGVHMTTSRMDVRAVSEAGRGVPGDGRFPAESRIGHVHLRVGDIVAAEHFYHDLLGLDVMARRPGGTFFSAGGYHHHIATNTWQSAGAPPRQPNTTGLVAVDIAVKDPELLARIEQRLGDAPIEGARGLSVLDPWSTELRLTLA